jgi:hypothetical protein
MEMDYIIESCNTRTCCYPAGMSPAVLVSCAVVNLVYFDPCKGNLAVSRQSLRLARENPKRIL